jgi:hypothetical protein
MEAHIIAEFKQTIQLARSCARCFGTDKAFCLWNCCLKAINAGVCCNTLEELRLAIQNKRRGMIGRGVVMLHGNALPQTAAATQDLVAKFGWEQFSSHFPPDQPPY